MIFTLENLGLAYRKAKVDLYYSTNASLFDIADYEDNLEQNLTRLLKLIKGKSEAWAIDPSFLGSWTLTPKSIDITGSSQADDNTSLIFAAPEVEKQSQTSEENKPKAEFRLMAQCSIDFHVLSALWMLEVGDSFDKKLSGNVYGSRLRRTHLGKINTLSIGSFQPYLQPFREWRNGGIKAMQSALNDNKKVLALTADVSSFYHKLHPAFMLKQDFLEVVDVELLGPQKKLHNLFIKALTSWAENTPLKKGLPVGLPASAVVANAALFHLDQFIEQQVVPLYYGRYVDDILLVMENTSNIKSIKEFWAWVFSRDGGSALLEEQNGSVLFKPDYLEESQIAFENNKNKLFILAGAPGITLVNAIAEQINNRASEWRALPDLPSSPNTVATDLLKATNNIGEHADNLRKTDALTLHRAGFAITLRDYEAYERDLPPDAWQTHRHAFFQAFIDHLLTPVKFFELAQYLPRIIRMATICEDFKYLREIIKALDSLVKTVQINYSHEVKALDEAMPDDGFQKWEDTLTNNLAENITSAFPKRLSKDALIVWKDFLTELKDSSNSTHIIYQKLHNQLSVYQELQKKQARLFSYDLAHIPLRFIGLPKDMASQRGIPSRKDVIIADTQNLLPEDIIQGSRVITKWLKFKRGTPAGLNFATRPFSLNELYLIAPEPFNPQNYTSLCKIILSLRGFKLTENKMPHWGKSNVLHVPNGKSEKKQTIAVSSWQTGNQSFVAAVMRQSDPDARQRYQRLNRLVNELISRPDGASYLILPEVSIPPQWFMRIAHKIRGRSISLIAGVEYLHAPKKTVHNQTWASLIHDGLGFPSSMLYQQDKQKPALHEEQELFRLAGVKLQPSQKQRWFTPPVIQHGDFRFALLACSELTNIRYRADLRGEVDALFVPEWNPDTDTFNALVESAALDIHAYIIQCNNRMYGDSRIRGPYKERWKRDVLRVKGGNHDYCITGEIDVRALREFQSSHRSPAVNYKPVPDGFNADMAYERKVLPKGKD